MLTLPSGSASRRCIGLAYLKLLTVFKDDIPKADWIGVYHPAPPRTGALYIMPTLNEGTLTLLFDIRGTTTDGAKRCTVVMNNPETQWRADTIAVTDLHPYTGEVPGEIHLVRKADDPDTLTVAVQRDMPTLDAICDRPEFTDGQFHRVWP